MIIDFGSWTPDQPRLNNPGCYQVSNMIPIAPGTYRPTKGYVGCSTNGTTGPAQGAFGGLHAGKGTIFVGDATNIYAMATTSATFEIAATVSVSSWYDFAQYGTKVIAVMGGASTSQAPLIWDLATDVPGTDLFTALGGGAPSAATVARVREHVVVGHTYDATDGEVLDRVRWSGFGNAETWTVDATTQADIQDLNNGGGVVKRITGGAVGIIYQESAITRMVYEGPPTIFRFEELYSELGTYSPRSVVTVGDSDYFYSTDGFIKLNRNTGAIEHIGDGKVDNYFRYLVSENNSKPFIVGAHDAEHTSIFWIRDKSSITDDTARYLIAYNYVLGMWYEFDVGVEVNNGQTPSYAHDHSSFLLGARLGDTPKSRLLNLLGTTTGPSSQPYYMAWWQGTASSMSAGITTTLVAINPGQRTLVQRVEPVMQAPEELIGTYSIEILGTDKTVLPNDPYAAGATTDTGAGFVAAYREAAGRVNNKFHAFYFSSTASSTAGVPRPKIAGIKIREMVAEGWES